MTAMRIDRQKATLEALPPNVQMLGDRIETGSVIFPPSAFHACLDDDDLAALNVPSNAKATVVRLTLRRTGGWGIRATCPWCGKAHSHGGGTGPLPYFGSRLSDCDTGGCVYLLDPRP